MRGQLNRLRRRLGKKTGLLIVLSLVAIGFLGSGAYAALGGAVRQSASGDVDLQKGLIGWWKLDGNAQDATPYRRNGAVTGTTNAADREGKTNSAKSFNGTSDVIKMLNFDSSVMTPASYGASWTLSVWAKTAAFNSTDNVLIGKLGCNGGIVNNFGANNGYSFTLWNSGCSANIGINYAPANPAAWHLITATYSNGAMTLYGDGQLVGTNTVSSLSSYNNDLSIGGRADNFNYFFNGSLDDARVYNRALNANEAKALYGQYDASPKLAAGQSGLIGHWPLDGSANDASPNRINGTLTNGPTQTNDRKGRANSAFSFNGTNQHIVVPATKLPTSAITVSAWVYQSTNADWYDLVNNNWGAAVGSSSWNLYTNASGNVIFGLWDSVSGQTNSFCANGSMTTGAWHHLAGTYDGTTLRVYIDGSACPSITKSGATLLHTGTFNIGDWGGASTHYIDDVRIYGRALSAAEIAAQYNSYDSQINLNSSPGNSTTTGNINQGLMGFWPFNGNAHDSTPYRSNGTVTGAALTTDRKGRANSAYAFDGTTGTYINVPDNVTAHDSNIGTWSAWIKPNAVPSGAGAVIMSKHDPSGSMSGISFLLQPSGDIVAQIKNTNSATAFGTSSGISMGQWHHVALTFNGNNTGYVYVDGVQIPGGGTPPSGWVFGANYPLRIGRSTDSFWNTFNGSIDEVRLYNRVLSTQEIQTLYNSNN